MIELVKSTQVCRFKFINWLFYHSQSTYRYHSLNTTNMAIPCSTIALQRSPEVMANKSSTTTELNCSNGNGAALLAPQLKRKQAVRFNLDSVSVTEIPSLEDYHFIQLYQMYYKQSDYDSFLRSYTRQAPMLAKAKLMKTSSPRPSRKIVHR